MNHKKWKKLVKPTGLVVKEGNDPVRQASLVAEPLEPGFGLTLGNAMRRVLISSLQGAAITSIWINNVLHEFSSVAGIREDVTDIVQNLKGVSLRMEVKGPKRLSLDVTGPAVVTAGDINESAGISVLNRDHVLCHLGNGVQLLMELNVNTGKGYVSADKNKPDDAPIGLIPIDAIYSPIKKVAYDVQPVREGNIHERLTFRIETDGSVIPEDAIAIAARIVQDQLSIFVDLHESKFSGKRKSSRGRKKDEGPEINLALLGKVDDLELSIRSSNCLKNVGIMYIADLVQKTEAEMMRTPNFGRTSLKEIKEVLFGMSLDFGMVLEDWPPDNIDELIRKYENRF